MRPDRLPNRIRIVNRNTRPEFNRYAVAKGRAGQGSTGSERHTGPSAHRFREIRRLSEALLLSQSFASNFSTLARKLSAIVRLQCSE